MMQKSNLRNMNELYCKVSWNLPLNTRIQEKYSFNNGILDLHICRTNNFNFDEKSFFYNDKTKVFCGIIGSITNLDKVRLKYSIENKNDVEIIERLYSLKRLNFISDLDGLFYIFIFDERIQKGYILQSEYGSNLPLYYIQSKNKFIFSTSLKRILKHFNKRELNIAAVHDFLYLNCIIPNKSTLVKGIYKLIPQRYIILNCEKQSISINSLMIKEKRIPKITAKNNMIESIEDSMDNLLNQLRRKNITLTVTAGWDGNLILYLIRNLIRNKITAVTIDGGRGVNEIPLTKQALKNYHNIKHITSKVKKETLNSFPDIVWIYEGYIFDTGMFLRYELAKILNKEKSKSLFLGSGADQVLNPRMGPGANKITEPLKKNAISSAMDDFRRITKNTLKRGFIGDLYNKITAEEPPEVRLRRKFIRNLFRISYNQGLDMNIKMHELMLNSFGIQGIYPFINKETVRICNVLRPINYDKHFYKEKVKEIMPSKIAKHLIKSRNVVNTESLFDVNKEVLMKVFKSKFVNKILLKSQINDVLKKPKEYHALVIQLVYLYLFNEIFINRKLDLKFDNAHLDMTLNDFLCT